MADAINLFPGLTQLGIPDTVHLQPANGFMAAEEQYWIAKLKFRDLNNGHGDSKSDTVVKACINFWSLTTVPDEYPLVAEFSFDYDMPANDDGSDDGKHEGHEPKAASLEEFPAEVVMGANRLFRNLQKQAGWMAPISMTKTAFAFEAF